MDVPKGKYVLHIDEINWIPSSLNAIKELSTIGVPIIVITNQQCVGLGLLDREVLEYLHVCINAWCDFRIKRFYYCPHLASAGCHCRKPQTGLLEKARKDFSISPHKSILVGDTDADILAARMFGALPIWVASGQQKEMNQRVNKFLDLSSAVPFIKQWFKTIERW